MSPRALLTALLIPELTALAAIDAGAARERCLAMEGDAHAFFRGSLALHLRELVQRIGCDGPWVWAVGDAHTDNLSTLAVGLAPARGQARIVYDFNDGDEEHPAPWGFDVLRLLTSLCIARGDVARGKSLRRLVRAVLDGYGAGCGAGDGHGKRGIAAVPACIAALQRADADPARRQAHAARFFAPSGRKLRRAHAATGDPGTRRFLQRHLPGFLAARLPAGAVVLDIMARRSGGLASLGLRRHLALVRERSGTLRLIELKERRASRLAAIFTATPFPPRARSVAAGLSVCLGDDPCQGILAAPGLPFLVRTRCHARSRLDLTTLDEDELPALCQRFGVLLARFHRRGLAALGYATPQHLRDLAHAASTAATRERFADAIPDLIEANAVCWRAFRKGAYEQRLCGKQ